MRFPWLRVAVLSAVGLPAHRAGGQAVLPLRVDTVARVLAAPSARVRGDTLWWVVPGAGFPRSDRPGTTDSLVVLFARDTAWRLVGRTRHLLPRDLLPGLREVRAMAEEGP